MEITHRHQGHEEHSGHHGHSGHLGHGGDHDWSDEAFVADWIERQEAHSAERRPLFAKMRAVIPKELTDTFRYADLGAGNGVLDELVLERYPKAQAVLIDGSEPMLDHARTRLEPFGGRAQYITADVAESGWVTKATGPFDVIMAARSIHHAGGPDRIRELFREILGLLAPGGLFINLDYVRFADPAFQQLGVWSGEDPDASYQIATPHMELPASLDDQLTWLRDSGFAAAECVYREFQTVIVVAARDGVNVPPIHTEDS
jgi:tRNA (cmo5U34)-methyltransferase